MSNAWAKAWSAAEISEVWDDFMAANLKPKWIKCSERMPEDGQLVLMAHAWGNKIAVDVASYHDGAGFFEPVSGYHWLDSVTHWQPLPEPPKEGE